MPLIINETIFFLVLISFPFFTIATFLKSKVALTVGQNLGVTNQIGVIESSVGGCNAARKIPERESKRHKAAFSLSYNHVENI